MSKKHFSFDAAGSRFWLSLCVCVCVQTQVRPPFTLSETALSLSPLSTSCFIWNQFPPRASSPGGTLSLVRRIYRGMDNLTFSQILTVLKAAAARHGTNAAIRGLFRAESQLQKALGNVNENEKTLPINKKSCMLEVSNTALDFK